VNDEPPFGSIQFTVLEVENALLELDNSKGPGPDGVPPLILKNCASGFACSSTGHWQRVSFPMDGNSRLLLPLSRVVGAMTISKYRGIAILSAIAKLFTFLVYRV
jgi:hypothetical protein